MEMMAESLVVYGLQVESKRTAYKFVIYFVGHYMVSVGTMAIIVWGVTLAYRW